RTEVPLRSIAAPRKAPGVAVRQRTANRARRRLEVQKVIKSAPKKMAWVIFLGFKTLILVIF
ncbi:MAG: hypothetical protein WA668_05675, partial [Candidatus Cybelea sp.]